MSKNLRERAEITSQEVLTILGHSKDDHAQEITDAIEHAIIRALIDERHRCADVALECCSEDSEKAKEVSDEIRRVKSVLMTNLSSMR
jgi:hypothetical protein